MEGLITCMNIQLIEHWLLGQSSIAKNLTGEKQDPHR